MTDRERVDTFLSLFKKLEKELVAQSKIKDNDYVSFSRALNKIHYDQLNPVITNQSNYDFLKTCSDVRNLLSHEENTVIPTDTFLKNFIRITDLIFNPLNCYQICSKQVFTCKYSDSLYKVMSIMDEKHISHVPVIDHLGSVIGMFSRQTFFDYIINEKEVTLSDELQISDFKNSISFDGHLNESYLFVSRNMSLTKAYDLLVKRTSQKKTVSLLLVTQNGKQSEKLIGVITALDLTRSTLES